MQLRFHCLSRSGSVVQSHHEGGELMYAGNAMERNARIGAVLPK